MPLDHIKAQLESLHPPMWASSRAMLLLLLLLLVLMMMMVVGRAIHLLMRQGQRQGQGQGQGLKAEIASDPRLALPERQGRPSIVASILKDVQRANRGERDTMSWLCAQTPSTDSSTCG